MALVFQHRANRISPAFTIIELLVVIGVIALLVGLLLPELSASRARAQRVASAANVKQCGMLQLTYALDSKDAYVNPFDAKNPQLWGIPWYQFVPQSVLDRQFNGISTYDFADTQYTTELFSAYWLSVATRYFDGSSTLSSILYAPQDTSARNRSLNSATAFNQSGERIWDGSYWASPTLWLDKRVFAPQNRVSVAPADVRYWRRNRTDDTLYPDAKVLVFERFDFSKSKRPARAGGTERFFPTFNNPVAKVYVAMGDGSCAEVAMSKIHAVGGTAASSTNRAVYAPAGDFDVPDMSMSAFVLHKDALENGDGTALGVQSGFFQFPGFFWATHAGVQGRDIPK